MIQEPYAEWTYREIECRLYKHFEPDGFTWAGYVKVGDEWQEAGPMLAASDEEEARSRVEDHVDKIIMMSKIQDFDDDDGGIGYDPIEIDPPDNPYPWPEDPDPVPTPQPWDPDPVPNPTPPNPIWISDDNTDVSVGGDEYSNTQTGKIRVRTTNDTYRTMHASKLRDAAEEGRIEDGKLVV